MYRNRILFSIVLYSLLLNDLSGSSWTENGDVIILTNENFHSKIQQYDVLLVLFYVKWCSHCRRMHPDYEQAATKLSKSLDNPIYLAKLDCTNITEPRCSKRYNIDGFPTLRIYRYGQYHDEELNHFNRTTDELVKTMKALKSMSTQRNTINTQAHGVKDETNKGMMNNFYLWSLIGIFYYILQKFFI
ncbi:unnamed protein product [Adineta ricciae]|uniref:Thioredoxin domain-containing protein n=1 Tax=Adineta ricciae TaxID=249248 RepID=A0A814VEQ1_ADIRI|nr:unnamed protein product [Adineta ricciae]CAF1186325.1 unnamed protein product [Adineta ricciae]